MHLALERSKYGNNYSICLFGFFFAQILKYMYRKYSMSRNLKRGDNQTYTVQQANFKAYIAHKIKAEK